MLKTPREGVNAARVRKMRREQRRQQLRNALQLTIGVGKRGLLILALLAVVGTMAWGGLSLWHKMGGGVLRGVECRGEVQCFGEKVLMDLGLERGMPLERIELAWVEKELSHYFASDVEVSRDLVEGLLVVELKPKPILGRFQKEGRWWWLRADGEIDFQEKTTLNLPLIDFDGPVDWEHVSAFLNQLRMQDDLWKELSLLKLEEGGRMAQVWLVSGTHRLLLPLDSRGVKAMERYHLYLQNRPELRSAKTIDLRFEGFAYVTST